MRYMYTDTLSTGSNIELSLFRVCILSVVPANIQSMKLGLRNHVMIQAQLYSIHVIKCLQCIQFHACTIYGQYNIIS